MFQPIPARLLSLSEKNEEKCERFSGAITPVTFEPDKAQIAKWVESKVASIATYRLGGFTQAIEHSTLPLNQPNAINVKRASAE